MIDKRGIYWRFYIFEIEKFIYCFDTIQHTIFSLNNELAEMIKKNDSKAIRLKYKKFYKSVIKSKQIKIQYPETKNCNVTINVSNNCNLNCNYCYRNKSEQSTLSNKDLKEIMHYITQKYYPDAKQYNFSFSYTSESSLDLKQLNYFDYLIGENEGYLFDKKDLSEYDASKIFFKLPKEIQRKYSSYNNYFYILNEILRKEKLWDFYKYDEEPYLKSVLYEGRNLSASRTIMANRKIINLYFSEFKLERPIKYHSLSFMTNGTNITDEYVNFVKSIILDTIYVSLDGPESIHNENRIYKNGKGTYKDVLSGIQKLKNAGIDVIPSVVITPEHPELDIIVSHLCSLGFNKMSFNLAREKNVFNKASIDILLQSIRNLFQKFFDDCKTGIVSNELHMLKNTMLFTSLKSIYYGIRIVARCTWGRELVIDSKGNMYHCNSTIGNLRDLIGHYSKGRKKSRVLKIPVVDKDKRCKYCYAKYLCSGTCHAEKIVGNRTNVELECYYKKNLVIENIKLYAMLHKHNLLKDFMKMIE